VLHLFFGAVIIFCAFLVLLALGLCRAAAKPFPKPGYDLFLEQDEIA
jgi:hypothetical protein